MRRARPISRVWVLLGLLLTGAGHAQELAAQELRAQELAAQELAAPALPDVAGKSFFLMDAWSGEVLAENAGRERLAPASLTKLMTGYAVFKALAHGKIALDDRVVVSEKAWRMTGSRMFIEVDTDVAVDDLIHGMIIQSGNDASVALAEHVAGSVDAFVELMNEYAAALGMTDTQFRNPTGLPARDHYSSARDLAVLSRAIVAEFPDRYGLYREREFTYNSIKQHNRNALLWRDENVDGLKTGHTNAAGYCLVASAERGGMRLIAVVLGMQTPKARTDAAQALLDYGFAAFETHKIYARGEPVTAARVWKGEPHAVALGLDEDLYVTVPRGTYGELAATLELLRDLVAPLDADAAVGRMQISFRGASRAVLPLKSLHPVSEAGLWTQMSDELELWLE